MIVNKFVHMLLNVNIQPCLYQLGIDTLYDPNGNDLVSQLTLALYLTEVRKSNIT